MTFSMVMSVTIRIDPEEAKGVRPPAMDSACNTYMGPSMGKTPDFWTLPSTETLKPRGSTSMTVTGAP